MNTLVILRSQFHNIWEGQKQASLTYKISFTGDIKGYINSYDNEENLIEEIAEQTDFWDCVTGFNESYSVEVQVLDDVEHKEAIQKNLTVFVLEDMREKTGKNPEDSFLDHMSEEKLKEIEEGVAWVKRNFPMLGY